jgi:hypothetical protein
MIAIFFSFVIIKSAIAINNIQDIDLGKKNEPVLIFLKNGHVLRKEKKLALKDPEIVRFFKLSKKQSENSHFIHIDYYKSVLPSIRDVEDLFNTGRKDFIEDSQCYQRAHVWAYEWRKKNVYPSKTWIFFTRQYIRKYNFDWWFHVAPSVHVMMSEGIKERILDIKYATTPLKLKSWTDIFIRDGSNCPVVDKYTDQADYPESSSCFVMKSSMYYYQPFELELKEVNGIEKSIWVKDEVARSYFEAFNYKL